MAIKISDLTAKGAAIAATDLLEISEVDGAGFISKSVTGQDIIDAVSGAFVPYTGATADLELGAFSIEATTLVKTGGLSTEFLMADGTTSSGGGASNPFPMFANVSFGIATTAGLFLNFGTQAATSFENLRQIPIPYAVTFQNFFLITNSTQPASGSAVHTVRKNGVDTSIVVTVPAGSAAGTFSNTINTSSFVAGDKISIKVVNNAATNTTLIALSIGTI